MNKHSATKPIRVGIDFGTTHTVVALADGGNYPVLSLPYHYQDEALVCARVPSCITYFDGGLFYGPAAWRCYLDRFDEGAVLIRSLKRLLKDWYEGMHLRLGQVFVSVEELLTGFLGSLRKAILEALDLEDATIEAVIAVPANASSSQRYATISCFRQAGFKVLRVLDEPSASAIQFVHERYKRWDRVKANVVIYDLGGGTFDTTLLAIDEGRYDPVHSRGISRLGGDDFDEALLGLVEAELEAPLGERDRVETLEAVRRAKEGITTRTRNLLVDVLGRPVSVPVKAFRDAVDSLIERSIDLVEKVISAAGTEAAPDRICLVGGASLLPNVAQNLRKRFGRSRVHQGLYPLESVAIGTAIQAGVPDLTVRDRLTNHFGVLRVREDGTEYVDVIFEKGFVLPAGNDIRRVSRPPYDPRHNIGRFRYLECNDLDKTTFLPSGETVYWNEIFFPYDSMVNPRGAMPAAVTPAHIHQTDDLRGERILEEYYLDSFGIVTSRISRTVQDRFSNCYNLFKKIAPEQGA